VAPVSHSAPRNAQSSFEQALVLLEVVPDSRCKQQSFDIRLELRAVLISFGETRKALQRLREAEVLAETLNDQRRRGRVCALMASLNSLHGELDEALANGTRALTIAERLGDLTLRLVTETHLGAVH
jgi:hypothetical protein